MNSNTLLHAIGDIDCKFINEAAPKAQKHTWKICAGIAACLCLISVALISGIAQQEKTHCTDDFFDDSPLATVQMIEYNNAYYEVVDSRSIRLQNGICEDITEDTAGEHIAYLQGSDIFTESMTPTDIELYSYSPYPCDAVMVIKEKDKYSVAVFCNYISVTADGNVNMKVSELYRLYGIYSASDIIAISEAAVGKESWSNRVTDRAVINAFYDITLSLESYNNSGYQYALFNGKSEEEQQEISICMADSMRYLYIHTSGGLKLTLHLYPEHGWLYASLTSYKMSDEALEWYSENLE